MDINEGDEITVSYSRDPESLYENYGFHCDCPGCPDVWPEVGEENDLSLISGVGPFYITY
jgi:hypothetical protein